MLNLNKKISARKSLLPLALLVGLIPAIWAIKYSLQSFKIVCTGVSTVEPPNISVAIIVGIAYLPLLFLCLFLYKKPPKKGESVITATFLVIAALVISLGASICIGGLSHFSLVCSTGWTF